MTIIYDEPLEINLDKLIDIGYVVNDGLGDDLRTAFRKVNQAFADINVDKISSVLNLGSPDGETVFGLFKDVVSEENAFGFKSLKKGPGILIQDLGDTLQISNSDDSAVLVVENAEGDNGGLFKEKIDNRLIFKNISAGTNIVVTDQDDNITITSRSFGVITTDNGIISSETYPEIVIVGTENVSVRSLDATITVDTTVPVKDILTTFDFGNIDQGFTNPLQLALAFSNIDFGSLEYPASRSLDLGSID